MLKHLVALVVLASALAGAADAQQQGQGVDKFSLADVPSLFINPIVVLPPASAPTQQAATPMPPVFIDPATIPETPPAVTPTETPPPVTLGQSLPPVFIDPVTIPETPPAVTLGQSLPPVFIDPTSIPSPRRVIDHIGEKDDIRERFRMHQHRAGKQSSLHYGAHIGKPGKPNPAMGRRDPRRPTGWFGVRHFKHATPPRVDQFSSVMMRKVGDDRNKMCGGVTEPLRDAAGNRLFCGRGGERCPAGSACDVHPEDRFAVCCQREEIISLPASAER